MIDGTLVGQVAAGAMQYLELEYAEAEGAEVLDVALVLAVRNPEREMVVTHVETGVERSVPFYVTAGLLGAGLTALGVYDREDDE